jgi:dephospho-CoA kinase
MMIVGLTGSIGMGKSTAAKRFIEHGIAVFDADAEVHRLYSGPLVAAIETAFPGTTDAKGVDRAKLSAVLAADPSGFERLETIVHPLVRDAEQRFLAACAAADAAVAVLEVPLLFESGLDAHVDVVVVVSASAGIQRQRVLDRPGMTAAKLGGLLLRQMPDLEKRRLAHFVVDTNGSVGHCDAQVDAIIGAIEGRPARAYQAYWA